LVFENGLRHVVVHAQGAQLILSEFGKAIIRGQQANEGLLNRFHAFSLVEKAQSSRAFKTIEFFEVLVEQDELSCVPALGPAVLLVSYEVLILIKHGAFDAILAQKCENGCSIKNVVCRHHHFRQSDRFPEGGSSL